MWPTPENACFVLAPMEGVTDFPMRRLLTDIGGFDYCVAEFYRVSQNIPPARVLRDYVPELETGGVTRAGVPVQLQLLGGDAGKLAETAALACEIGAVGIDLNFGCPAKTVNRHDGGATLLKYPHRIREIVSQVRSAVPRDLPVSAKLRLGWEKLDDILVNAEQAALGGASWLTIHARTKLQGYAPPAHWHWVGEVRKRMQLPIVVNGDIRNEEDFARCREVSGCQHFMIGRGALGDPFLARRLRGNAGTSPTLEEWRVLFARFHALGDGYYTSRHATLRRVKQWANLGRASRTTSEWFERIKTCTTIEEVFQRLEPTSCELQ